MIIPFYLNRYGQAITLSKELLRTGVKTPQALKPLAEEARRAGKPMTFAMTFPPGTHAMWMRYWLAAGGINPDRGVTLITIPPPQMVANMKVGKMDGFCVGEPWNARAIADGIGFTAVTTQQIWRDHPEKVLGFTEEFAEKHPKTARALLRALLEASQYVDKLENRAHVAEVVARPQYINTQQEVILGRLRGDYDYGDGGAVEQDPYYMTFFERHTNFPWKSHGVWWLSQFRRWGMTKMGLNSPTEGGVILAGREVVGPGTDRGVVFQSPALLPWLTARGNVQLAVEQVAGRYSRAARRQLADRYLASVGLVEVADRYPDELSAGMRQRVGIARTLALEPKVLLLDEPFSLLDALTRMELQEELMRLWDEDRKAMLMVTHDVDEALFLADRIVMMTSGPAATVGEILAVPFPRPRCRAEVLNHPAYYHVRDHLIAFLEERASMKA
jgi:nitrate ABC transporter ATP-binding subunit